MARAYAVSCWVYYAAAPNPVPPPPPPRGCPSRPPGPLSVTRACRVLWKAALPASTLWEIGDKAAPWRPPSRIPRPPTHPRPSAFRRCPCTCGANFTAM
ncbi:Hypothetical predicted protein [Cloeon dipterum]|uniref:Uncharacterized protein n=1 Tax=Cloeon dipterum TaxID=197152 RepID=A0A8S1CCB0_9INSE|nr:Hypothetical predicted protein [Cloeon dipterum]